jgi:hypothetical protein
MHCNKPIYYYAANYDDICAHCAGDVDPWSSSEPFYPQCEDRKNKERIPNAKSKEAL